MAHLSTKWLKVTEPSPHVIHVELARKPVNAFTEEFWREYGRLFNALAEQPDVRAVVLSSAQPKIFTAGLDLAEADSISTASGEPAKRGLQIRHLLKEFQYAIGTPERCPFPVIAALHGPVIGLGIDMTSACDIRYAASNASFSVKEVDIGMAADIGTLAYLPKIGGNHSLARELAYTARPFDAAEAAQLGFVSRVVEGGRAEVVAAALELAKLIASKSPIGVAGTKQLFTHARDHSVAENLEYTAVWNPFALQGGDMAEALAARKANRQPQFQSLKFSKL